MGKGGQLHDHHHQDSSGEMKSEYTKNMLMIRRPPVHKKPPFTLSDIKKAIPPHCFKRSLIKSTSYLVFDLLVCFSLSYAATNYFPLLLPTFKPLAWTTYFLIQGTFMFGLWVIAHELGHQSFSEYPLLNDTVGFFLHSLLLTPYFAWKISHRHHHSNTNSIERDENHVPSLKVPSYYKYLNNTFGRIFLSLFALFLGWPLYLCVNFVGRSYDRWANHFNPYSPIFSERERLLILISDIGYIGGFYLVYCVSSAKGFSWMMLVYGAPLLVMNAYIIMVTTLHHTHPSVPHYDSTEWDWMRGALATCDRDYGFLNLVINHIGNTHVIHHFFPTMPHYHLDEATEAIKPLLGDYYNYDNTPFYKAFWREATECIYVEAEQQQQQLGTDHDQNINANKGIYWYTNKLN